MSRGTASEKCGLSGLQASARVTSQALTSAPAGAAIKTVHVGSRPRVLNALLRQAGQENFVLRASDGREFVLAEIDDFSREIELTRENKKLMAFLDRRGRENATVPLAEARRRLGRD